MEIKDLGMKYPIALFDRNGNQVYREDSDGFWWKQEYDEEQRETRFENSTGRVEINVYEETGDLRSVYKNSELIEHWEFDINGNITFKYTASNNYWWEKEYDSNNNVIYHENSIDGIIIPKKVERTVVVNGREYSESTVQRALEYYITS